MGAFRGWALSVSSRRSACVLAEPLAFGVALQGRRFGAHCVPSFGRRGGTVRNRQHTQPRRRCRRNERLPKVCCLLTRNRKRCGDLPVKSAATCRTKALRLELLLRMFQRALAAAAAMATLVFLRDLGLVLAPVWAAVSTSTLPLVASNNLVLEFPARSALAASQLPYHELRKKALAWVLLFASSSALAAAETAITALYPWKVRDLAESEGSNSPFGRLNQDITRYLTTILVASTICGVYSTALATEMATRIFGSVGVGYATGVMTVVFLFFGEILPKTLAVHNSEKVARFMLRPLHLLSLLLYPVGKAFSFLVNLTLTASGLEHSSEPLVSENELRLITAGARRSGGINIHEQDMIESVLDLEETEVREIMKPRVEMTCISCESTLEEFLALEKTTHYSRYPVFKENVDDIIGILYVKRLLEFLGSEDGHLRNTRIGRLAEPAMFVPESLPVWRVLEEMRRKRIHMAIVVDEYGGTAGLVTLEDIMEEIVGEIYDEDDSDYEEEGQEIVRIDENTWVMDGQARLERVAETIGMEVSEDDLHEYGTIGGFLCDRMDGIPDPGDSAVIDAFQFFVDDADDRRILRVRARRFTAAPTQTDAPDVEDPVQTDIASKSDRAHRMSTEQDGSASSNRSDGLSADAAGLDPGTKTNPQGNSLRKLLPSTSTRTEAQANS
jgi:putative hemolysin